MKRHRTLIICGLILAACIGSCVVMNRTPSKVEVHIEPSTSNSILGSGNSEAERQQILRDAERRKVEQE